MRSVAAGPRTYSNNQGKPIHNITGMSSHKVGAENHGPIEIQHPCRSSVDEAFAITDHDQDGIGRTQANNVERIGNRVGSHRRRVGEGWGRVAEGGAQIGGGVLGGPEWGWQPRELLGAPGGVEGDYVDEHPGDPYTHCIAPRKQNTS